MRNGIPQGYAVSQNSAKMGVPLQVYTLNHVIYISTIFSYAEKCAEFKNQTLKKSAGTQKCYAQWNTPGVFNISK